MAAFWTEKKNRIKKAFREFLLVIKRAIRKWQYVRRPENLRALGHLYSEGKRILGAVLPKKGSGYLRLGLSDPYETGRAMELFAVLYPLYGKHISVSGAFEERVVETELNVRGRIYLFTILRSALSLYRDRDLRKLYAHFKEGENGRVKGRL